MCLAFLGSLVGLSQCVSNQTLLQTMKIYIIIITVAMGIVALLCSALVCIFCNEVEIDKSTDPIPRQLINEYSKDKKFSKYTVNQLWRHHFLGSSWNIFIWLSPF